MIADINKELKDLTKRVADSLDRYSMEASTHNSNVIVIGNRKA